MKMTKLLIVSLAAMFLASGMAYANGGADNEGKEGGKKMKEVYKELNVTPDQQTKLEENHKAQMEAVKGMKAQLKDDKTKLQAALKDPATTRAAVDPILNDIKALHGKMVDQRADGIFAVKGILTPEQFTKFQAIMEKKKEDMKSRFHGWFGKKGQEQDQGQGQDEN